MIKIITKRKQVMYTEENSCTQDHIRGCCITKNGDVLIVFFLRSRGWGFQWSLGYFGMFEDLLMIVSCQINCWEWLVQCHENSSFILMRLRSWVPVDHVEFWHVVISANILEDSLSKQGVNKSFPRKVILS